ncbi:MAG TPA: HAD family phosphatase [Terriglobia bacterium]|nr:HAD family phosphatase [Terriglobia bacterium]
MLKITAVFCDVGGVLLTNGWDHGERSRLVANFGLDANDFEGRHQMVSAALDSGHLTLDHYLDRTIFYRSRAFRKDQVRDFMYAQSEALPNSLPLIARLSRAPDIFLAALNNESRELNLYRIEKFRLRNYFSVFFTSCYLGISKPHRQIYQLALDVSQRQAEECLFIDDRPLNLEGARQVGLQTIQFLNAEQLEKELVALGLRF